MKTQVRTAVPTEQVLSRSIQCALQLTGGKVDPAVRANIIRSANGPYTEHMILDCEVKSVPEAVVKDMVAKGTMRRVNNPARVFEFVASTDRTDRMGDIVRQRWELRNFRSNPVILYGHNPFDSKAVMGRSVKEEVEEAAPTKGAGAASGARLKIWVEFAELKHNPEAELTFRMYRDGFLKAGSVGFNPLKINTVSDPSERQSLGLGQWGVVFEKSELLEFSLVAVPANPDAVIQSMSQSKGYGPKEIEMARRLLRKPDDAPPDGEGPVGEEDTVDDGAAEEKNPLDDALEQMTVAKDALTQADQILADMDGDKPKEDEGKSVCAQVAELKASGEGDMMEEDDEEIDIAGAREKVTEASEALDKAIGLIENIKDEEEADKDKPKTGEEDADKDKGMPEDTKKEVMVALGAARGAIDACINILEATGEEPADDNAEGDGGEEPAKPTDDKGGSKGSTTAAAPSGSEDPLEKEFAAPDVYERLLAIDSNLNK